MSVRIRLTRMGRIRRPFYRIGVFDSRSRRDGRALEYLGYYDPMETSEVRIKLDKEAAERWVSEGAIPSETVASFFRAEGVQYKRSADRTKRNKARAEKRKVARAAKTGGSKKTTAAKGAGTKKKSGKKG